MTDQFFIDSVGYKARHFYLLIQECLVALWFSPIARLGRKREINGYMMLQLYDSAMYGQAFICTKYSVQSIYSLRIYAENVVQADRYQLLPNSHSHRSRIDVLIGGLLVVSYSSSYHRFLSRVMVTVNCRGGRIIPGWACHGHDYGQTSVIQSRVVSSQQKKRIVSKYSYHAHAMLCWFLSDQSHIQWVCMSSVC